MLTSSSLISVPLFPIVKSVSSQEQHELVKSYFFNPWVQRKPFNARGGYLQMAAACPVGLGAGLRSFDRSRAKWSSSTVCSAALNARCGAEQTQTVTREAPTITQAPTHIQEKSPQLDDGGTGFPPRDDGDGGGGGGGGGGNWSGGFFFFGFLAFLGFLKDKEGEGDYDSNRRR
ncbi:hypothetical protein SAY87_009549 [Trapa incisa]|uniref:Uncharacterized protein n=1 Tax=Trapa incisa TaxID=236973 RepID=A0AAN7PX76_9MYRT|nr:hypothetical protein SAY87_009549 [Trapa incisa]